MAILPDNEFYTFENRNYLNPQVSLDEQNAFIDNLRNTQQANNAEINMQTQKLGTDVPSSVGGLTGANSYFSSRYQTPQMNSLAANLRATAQAKALNDVLANEQAKMQKRYNDAYHASQIRSTNTPKTEGGVKYNDNTVTGNGDLVLTANGGDTVIAEPDGEGGVTGRIWKNGQWIDQNVKYTHKGIRPAGLGELSDIFTHEFNYTINNETGPVELELGGFNEELVRGSDGNYYIRSIDKNKYTPVSGTSGSTEGGSKWWKA